MGANSQISPYYPPRAGWYSYFCSFWYPLRRWLYLDRLNRIGLGDVGSFVLGLVLPGWSLVWSDRPIWGVILGTTYCVAVPVFVVWRGYIISNLALMTMLSIHAGGILRAEPSTTFLSRCLWSVAAFLLIACLIYTPLIRLMERRWFVAFKMNDHVVCVRTGVNPIRVQRGDWIAYQLSDMGIRHYGQHIVVNSGCTLGKVLGVAGDVLTFTSNKVLVGVQEFAPLPYMPTKGTVTVQAGSWFVWPQMNVDTHGMGNDVVSSTMMQLAKVDEKSYIGTARQQWWWRRQTLP